MFSYGNSVEASLRHQSASFGSKRENHFSNDISDSFVESVVSDPVTDPDFKGSAEEHNRNCTERISRQIQDDYRKTLLQ